METSSPGSSRLRRLRETFGFFLSFYVYTLRQKTGVSDDGERKLFSAKAKKSNKATKEKKVFSPAASTTTMNSRSIFTHPGNGRSYYSFNIHRLFGNTLSKYSPIVLIVKEQSKLSNVV